MTNDLPESWRCLIQERDQLIIERDAALGFKEWVHKWLSYNGVPHDADCERTEKTGCRVGGRLEFIAKKLANAESALCGLVQLLEVHGWGEGPALRAARDVLGKVVKPWPMK